jgi:dTDP-4-dehydrorhamnose reductase
VVSYNRTNLDVCDFKQIQHVLTLERPDVVINATAYTAVDLAEECVDECYAVNAGAPESIAAVCEQIGAICVHISSDYVFDGNSDSPYVESDPVSPSSVYGASKLAGENAVANACFRHIILRTSWVFGSHGNNFLNTMLKLAQKRNIIGVVCDQNGAPTSANGIASTIVSIINQTYSKNDGWGIYHYSGYPYTSWHSFAEAIFSEAKKQNLLPHEITLNPISSKQYETPVKRPMNSRLNCNKLKIQFGIEADDWFSQMQSALAKIKSP